MDCFDVLLDTDDFETSAAVADAHAQYVALMARRYDDVAVKEYPLTHEFDDDDYPF